MPASRSELVKTLEAGFFALSLIILCLAQSTKNAPVPLETADTVPVEAKAKVLQQ